MAVALAPLIWKLIINEPVSILDLEDTDLLYVNSLRTIRDIHLSGVNEENFHEIIPLETFEGTSCNGKVNNIIIPLPHKLFINGKIIYIYTFDFTKRLTVKG